MTAKIKKRIQSLYNYNLPAFISPQLYFHEFEPHFDMFISILKYRDLIENKL